MVKMFYRIPWCVPSWGWAEWCRTVGCLLLGRCVEGAFVDRFAESVGERAAVRYAVPVNRGRTAIELALRAMGIGQGDDVVIPSYICRSVLNAVRDAGARAVFADVDERLQVTAETVLAARTARTRCAVVAHLFGNVARVDEVAQAVSKWDIAVIDDAAQGYGARLGGRTVGSFGRCGVVSCGMGKALAGAAGGALLTDDEALYEAARSMVSQREQAGRVIGRVLSTWVWRRARKVTSPLHRVMVRVKSSQPKPERLAALSNLDAGIGLAQVSKMTTAIELRRRTGERLLEALGPLGTYSITDLSPGGCALKLVLVLPEDGPSAQTVIRALGRAGVECQQGYRPLHDPQGKDVLPVTESLWFRVVCIPLQTAKIGPCLSARLRQAVGDVLGD